MAAINTVSLGTDSTVGIGAAGQSVPAGTFVDIGGITSGTLTISSTQVDTTNNDDNGFTSFLPGNTTITLSVECRFDVVNDTTGQAVIEDIAGDVDGGSFKALRSFRVRPVVGSGTASEWSFDGYVTSFDLSMGNDEAVNLSFEVTSVGASIGTAVPIWSVQS